MAAENALNVGGLAVARVVIGIAMPLDGVPLEVDVGCLDDRHPGDRRKLEQKHNSGGLPDPEQVAHPRHAAKASADDRALQGWAIDGFRWAGLR